MSNPHSHAKVPGGGGPDSLHDMNLGKIVIVGAVSLAVFAVGIVWAYQILVGREAESHAATGAAAAPTEYGKDEIGIVDQVPFDLDNRIEKWRAHNKKALSTYGWVDRAKGIARIPIEQAMERVVASPPDIPGEGVAPQVRAPVQAPPAAAPEKGREPRDGQGTRGDKDVKGGTAK
jgi:hypothetical protein